MAFATGLRRWRQFLIAGLFVLLSAYVVAAGPGSRLANADSLIPVFVSLESWTLFYWGQDRFGMLLPLVAMPVTDSFWNLMVQNILTVALLLAGVAGIFGRQKVAQPIAWALLTLAVLLTFRAGEIPLLLLTTNQSYGPSLGLFGIAIYLLRRATLMSRVAALTLMTLAAWTNVGVALFVGIVALTLVPFRATRGDAIAVLAGTTVSIFVHIGLQRVASEPLLDMTTIDIPAIGAVPSLVWAFWHDAGRLMGQSYWLTVGVAWMVAAVLGAQHKTAGQPVLLLCAVGSATILYGSAMAVFFDGLGRHLAPAVPLLIMCPLLFLARTVPRIGDWRFLPAALLCLVVVQTGVDTPTRVRQQLLGRLGQGRAEKLYVAGVIAVTGNYWSVWPWTFATNMLHEASDGRRPVVPVTMRAERLIERRRAEVTARTKVAVVPSGDLAYWVSARLPPLQHQTEFPGYALGIVGELEQPISAQAATAKVHSP